MRCEIGTSNFAPFHAPDRNAGAAVQDKERRRRGSGHRGAGQGRAGKESARTHKEKGRTLFFYGEP
eukprot:756396-Hanusia_phi.AAC.1